MKPGLKIYVSGPYTLGDQAANVRNAVLAGIEIMKWGHYPFIPHLSHFTHYLIPHAYEVWMQQDFAWLKVCNVLVRLPGLSSGADREVALAIEEGIVVCEGMEDLHEWLTTTK